MGHSRLRVTVALPLLASKITIDLSDCNSFKTLRLFLESLSLGGLEFSSVAMEGLASSTMGEIYVRAHEETVLERFFKDVYSILKSTHLKNFFNRISSHCHHGGL